MSFCAFLGRVKVCGVYGLFLAALRAGFLPFLIFQPLNHCKLSFKLLWQGVCIIRLSPRPSGQTTVVEAVTNLEYKSDNKITDQPNCIESEIDDDLHHRIELKSANCKICFPRKTQERQKVKCDYGVKHIEVVDLATKLF